MNKEYITPVFWGKRYDGVDLYICKDEREEVNPETGEAEIVRYFIEQEQTGQRYEEAIDVEDSPFTYFKTNERVDVVGENDVF